MRRHIAALAVVVAAVAVAVAVLARVPARPTAAAEEPAGPKSPKAWHRPRFSASKDERGDMVRRQIERRGVADAAVLQALRNVPRHEFVPEALKGRAYDDTPLPIGHGQTISQPYIVGFMTETLALKPDHKVLEVGTGSGYQAAVLAELTPHVFSIEIVKALGDEAKARLARLGYKTIESKVADGYYGWEEKGPFDAIIVTCAAGSVPPPLLKQLKPGGRMCIPVGPPGMFQQLVLVTKDADGQVTTKSLMGVAFVPLTREVR